jgi:hypothetical protein
MIERFIEDSLMFILIGGAIAFTVTIDLFLKHHDAIAIHYPDIKIEDVGFATAEQLGISPTHDTFASQIEQIKYTSAKKYEALMSNPSPKEIRSTRSHFNNMSRHHGHKK